MKIDLSRKEVKIFVAVGILLFILPILFTQLSFGISFRDTGNIGDTIGGITAPFLSFFGAILLYLALKAQIEANDKIQTQFERQKALDYRTNFESNFFNLLSIHHQIVENLDFEANRIIAAEPELMNFIDDLDDLDSLVLKHEIFSKNTIVHKSRDVFKFSLSFLYTLLEHDLYLNNFNVTPTLLEEKVSKKYYNSEFNNLSLFESSNIKINNIELSSKFLSIYNYVYGKLSADFGHYFRNLYRIIKIVDEAKFDENSDKDFEIKYSYTSIIRAQLSDDEIKWIFFNCLATYGVEKFKPFLEKYSFLKIINKEEEVFKFYSSFYASSAFEKSNK